MMKGSIGTVFRDVNEIYAAKQHFLKITSAGNYWLEVDDYEDVRLTQALLRLQD